MFLPFTHFWKSFPTFLKKFSLFTPIFWQSFFFSHPFWVYIREVKWKWSPQQQQQQQEEEQHFPCLDLSASPQVKRMGKGGVCGGVKWDSLTSCAKAAAAAIFLSFFFFFRSRKWIPLEALNARSKAPEIRLRGVKNILTTACIGFPQKMHFIRVLRNIK